MYALKKLVSGLYELAMYHGRAYGRTFMAATRWHCGKSVGKCRSGPRLGALKDETVNSGRPQKAALQAYKGSLKDDY